MQKSQTAAVEMVKSVEKRELQIEQTIFMDLKIAFHKLSYIVFRFSHFLTDRDAPNTMERNISANETATALRVGHMAGTVATKVLGIFSDLHTSAPAFLPHPQRSVPFLSSTVLLVATLVSSRAV